jgi:hypothetical protein
VGSSKWVVEGRWSKLGAVKELGIERGNRKLGI